MRKLCMIVLPFTPILVTVASTSKRQEQEQSLRETLAVLRSEIAHTVDHQRPPASLEELISSGYMKQTPIGPFTARNDTWQTETSGEDFKVYSGSEGVSRDGTRYNSW